MKKTKNSSKANSLSNEPMKIASFFAGAGGLDLGFEKAGFKVVWANEYDKSIWATYRRNHKKTILDERSIISVDSSDVPDCDGIIGGPPCQSWSEAGALRGIRDQRGQLFFEFMRILADKRPKFFLAENVSGMMLPSNINALQNIISLFEDCGYDVSFTSVNASDYGVPQDRKRVFFIGYRKDLGMRFVFPKPTTSEEDSKNTLRKAIGDLCNTAVAAIDNRSNPEKWKFPNHEYMVGGFSPIYMSRNRVRSWDQVSFTIQAGGRHAPIHPQAPKMQFIEQDKRIFVKGKEHLYRRLSVRECARIQTFPDEFIFEYQNVHDGYKMIGNAVPVLLAKAIALQIKKDLMVHHQKPISFETQAGLKSYISGNHVRERMAELVNAV